MRGGAGRARTPRCAAARAEPARTTTRRGGGRPGDDEEGRRAGDDLEGGHGRVPAGDPRTAGEERGGARGRASRGGRRSRGGGQRRSELGGEGSNLLGVARLVPAGITSRH